MILITQELNPAFVPSINTTDVHRKSTRMSVYILLMMLVIIPFILVFQGRSVEDGGVGLSSIVNHLALCLALVLWMKHANKMHHQTMTVVMIFLSTYVINYLATQYASTKWLINSFAFLFVFISVATAVIKAKYELLVDLSKKIDIAIMLAMWCLTFIFMFTVLGDPAGMMENFLRGDHNSNTYRLTISFSVVKPALAFLLYIIIPWNMVHWKTYLAKRKMLFLIFIIMGFPFWIGIRTLILSFLILSLFLLITRRSLAILLTIVISVIASVFIVAHWTSVMDIVAMYYDRLPSLLFALDTLIDQPMGLGNGGYHVVVSNSQELLFAQYATENMRGFWPSPESTLVYFISSFGVLSAVFFGFYFYLLNRGRRLLHNKYILLIEKSVLLSCSLVIFAGISQNYVSASGLLWWIYMAAGFGMVARHSSSALRLRGRTALPFISKS